MLAIHDSVLTLIATDDAPVRLRYTLTGRQISHRNSVSLGLAYEFIYISF